MILVILIFLSFQILWQLFLFCHPHKPVCLHIRQLAFLHQFLLGMDQRLVVVLLYQLFELFLNVNVVYSMLTPLLEAGNL
ncbi:MAG TPA: hypothetical protein DCZ05_09450 [Deltaproteobacteria bacterium]|nr:hypothetical protein [Deltaproteobacteria bacterium]